MGHEYTNKRPTPCPLPKGRGDERIRKDGKMKQTFQQTINMGPALAANHTFNFKCHADMQLIFVSACNSTAYQGTLKIGSTSDDDAYLAALSVGASGTPAVADTFDDFIGGQFPHFAKGDVISVLVTDHGSHMANVSVVMTFTEG
jgi:hypothetical protein